MLLGQWASAFPTPSKLNPLVWLSAGLMTNVLQLLVGLLAWDLQLWVLLVDKQVVEVPLVVMVAAFPQALRQAYFLGLVESMVAAKKVHLSHLVSWLLPNLPPLNLILQRCAFQQHPGHLERNVLVRYAVQVSPLVEDVRQGPLWVFVL